jgi:hypothetical protein
MEKLTEKIKEKLEREVSRAPGYQGVVEACFTNRIFMLLGSDSNAPISIPFQIKYTRKAKSGNVRTYKEESQILPSYCPFCGEKYNS